MGPGEGRNTITVKPLPIAELMATAKSDRADWVRQAQTRYLVSAGGKLTNGWLFIPADLDPAKLASITLQVNGQTARLPGQMYTPAEIAELIEQWKQQQKQ